MSNWFQFQVTAHQSEAITILNQVRHCLTGRRKHPLTRVQQRICRQAFALRGQHRPSTRSREDLAPALELSQALHGAASSLRFDDKTRRTAFTGFEALIDGSGVDPAVQQTLIHLVERSMDRIAEVPLVYMPVPGFAAL